MNNNEYPKIYPIYLKDIDLFVVKENEYDSVLKLGDVRIKTFGNIIYIPSDVVIDGKTYPLQYKTLKNPYDITFKIPDVLLNNSINGVISFDAHIFKNYRFAFETPSKKFYPAIKLTKAEYLEKYNFNNVNYSALEQKCIEYRKMLYNYATDKKPVDNIKEDIIKASFNTYKERFNKIINSLFDNMKYDYTHNKSLNYDIMLGQLKDAKSEYVNLLEKSIDNLNNRCTKIERELLQETKETLKNFKSEGAKYYVGSDDYGTDNLTEAYNCAIKHNIDIISKDNGESIEIFALGLFVAKKNLQEDKEINKYLSGESKYGVPLLIVKEIVQSIDNLTNDFKKEITDFSDRFDKWYDKIEKIYGSNKDVENFEVSNDVE